jgi:DNA-binding transcriptional ArsR family regulator
MQDVTATDRLSELLETHFCDAKNPQEHESLLKELADEYLRGFDFERSSRLYSALGDKNRLNILQLLTFREMCVCELAAALNITQPNLTYHVKKLENIGLIRHDKRGKWVYYSLADEKGLKHIMQENPSNLPAVGDECA